MNSNLAARATHSRDITQLADDLVIAAESRGIDSHEPRQGAALPASLDNLDARARELTKQIDHDGARESRQIESAYASACKRVTDQVLQVRDDILVGLRVRLDEAQHRAQAQSHRTPQTTVAPSEEVLRSSAQELDAIIFLQSANPPMSGTALDQARLKSDQTMNYIDTLRSRLSADSEQERNICGAAVHHESPIKTQVDQSVQHQVGTAVHWFNEMRVALNHKALMRRKGFSRYTMFVPFVVTALAFIWGYLNGDIAGLWQIVVAGVAWGVAAYWIRSKVAKDPTMSVGWSAGSVALGVVVVPIATALALAALAVLAIALIFVVFAAFADD